MRLVGDRERQRTADALRCHYLAGRLSEDELDDRLETALRARTRLDLVLAARQLPGHAVLEELLGPPVRAASHAIGRAALFVVLAAVWLAGSVLLLLSLGVSVLVGAASTGTLAGFPLAWALMTWIVWRVWVGRSAR